MCAHPVGGYRNAAGKRIPGTTTIIGRFKDSGGLLHWAFAQGRAAERGEIEHLYDKRDEAAEAGTLAHAMVEASIHGYPWEEHDDVTGNEPSDTVKAALEAFKGYKRWTHQTKLKIVLTEPQLVSEVYQFGGAPDAIGEIDGEYCLLDWKSSNGIYPDYLIQVGGGYDILIEECLPEYPITGGFHICRFSKEFGDFHHHYFADLPEAREQFLLFRKAYDIDKVLKRRAK